MMCPSCVLSVASFSFVAERPLACSLLAKRPEVERSTDSINTDTYDYGLSGRTALLRLRKLLSTNISSLYICLNRDTVYINRDAVFINYDVIYKNCDVV